MNLKKFLTLSFLTVTLCSTLIGCGSESSDNSTNNKDIYTEVGTFPIVKEGHTDSFTIFAPIRPSVTSYDSSINKFTQYMEDLTGIDLIFTEVTNADKQQKFNIMMTGGDYTDVIMGMYINSSELLLYGQQGILIPLNDLIDKYAPNIKKALDENPLVKETWTLEDGNIYCLPAIGGSTHGLVSEKMSINKTWLDNLNLEVPTTHEEFYQVLKAFKEKDANGNGDPNDEIPLSGSMKGWATNPIPFLLNMFIPASPSTQYLNLDENNQVYFVKTTEEWKECLKYMHKLYSEGLIDPLLFSQTSDQLMKLGSNPVSTLIGASTGGSVTVLTNVQNYDIWQQYMYLPPLEGPTGLVSAARNISAGSSVLSITDKCENPEAVLRFFDYFYTDSGTVEHTYGILEDGGYKLAQDDELNIIGEPAKYNRSSGTDGIQDLGWNRVGPDYRPDNYDLWFTALPDPTKDGEKFLYEVSVNHYLPVAQDEKTMLPKLSYTSDESRVIVDVTTNMNIYIDQITAEFINGTKNIDEEWNTYLDTLNNYGLSEYLNVQQAAYDRKYK